MYKFYIKSGSYSEVDIWPLRLLLFWVSFLIVYALQQNEQRELKIVVHSAQNVSILAYFNQFWSSEVIIHVLHPRKQTFSELFTMHILLATQDCIHTLSEHEPWWLSRHVTQLRRNKSTSICIFLEVLYSLDQTPLSNRSRTSRCAERNSGHSRILVAATIQAARAQSNSTATAVL